MSTVIDKKVDLLTREFIPFCELFKLMQQEKEIPYASKFSFKPYLDAVSGKMCTACPDTKGLLTPVVENAHNYIESGEGDISQMKDHDHFKTMVSLVVPSMFFKDDRSFIAPPFKKEFLVTTPAFDDMINADQWEIKIDEEKILSKQNKSVSLAFVHILNKYYGQKIDTSASEVITLRNVKTGIVRHYQISLKLDFISITNLKDIPKLSQSQINTIISRIDDVDYVLKYLPADTYEFSGFTLGNFHDISDLEVLSQFKHWLNTGNKDLRPEHFLSMLEDYLQSFLNIPNIRTGSIMTEHRDMHRNDIFSLTDSEIIAEILNDENKIKADGIYRQMIDLAGPILCEDLTIIEEPSYLEKKLLKNNIESVILYPILNKTGDICSILEIGSHERNNFNDFIFKKLKPFFEILESGYDAYMQDIDNRITGIIQQKFTSIHPSVQWKFEDVALKYLSNRIYDVKHVDFEPIVFQDVYPLYAQSDIVSSSSQRNQAIQEDLLENLEALTELMDKWFKKSNNHLLESYHLRVEQLLENLKLNFVSNDETQIVNLLVNEVHPLLARLAERNTKYPKKAYEQYLQLLDSELNIVYKKRRDFESSVNKLNMAISEFVEREDEKLQVQLPHYFEKYKTDGVEYNIYLGQSLLNNAKFATDDLKNFRLWQLVNTCEIVRLVEEMKPDLEVPLDTAQLIFVYNHALSIRFRMDEKQFDVDGAYNVRYEILKKRIDKAIIKGTGERLTVAGKIAVVYLSEQEKIEYLEFFEYLKIKGYIEDNVEDVELDKLQGAEGLKALRITVKH